MSMLPEKKPDTGVAVTPLYAEVKQHILARVRSGEWSPDYRITSESELVEQLGVSRMTVNRALRELSLEGVLVRMQGRGSFVAGGNSRSDVFAVTNIADEIRARGHDYGARVLLLDTLKATPDVADLLELPIGSPVFHSIIVHSENDVPIQLEDRFVNPLVVPDYLGSDFSKLTPNEVLTAVVPWSEAEHRIEAVLPQPWECKLLAISRADPCLLIRRRTWATGWVGAPAQEASEEMEPLDHVVTSVRLLLPGGRYRIENRRHSNRVG